MGKRKKILYFRCRTCDNVFDSHKIPKECPTCGDPYHMHVMYLTKKTRNLLDPNNKDTDAFYRLQTGDHPDNRGYRCRKLCWVLGLPEVPPNFEEIEHRHNEFVRNSSGGFDL